MNNVSDEQLLEAYNKLSNRFEIYLKQTRFWKNLVKISSFFIFVTFIIFILLLAFEIKLPILIPFLSEDLNPIIWVTLFLIIFWSLQTIGNSQFKKRGHPYRLTSEERLFINVYTVINNINTYLDDRLEYDRINAFNKFESINEAVKEWYLGNIKLTRELIGDHISNFKSNIETILLPIISRGKLEDLKVVLYILKIFASFLLNPSVEYLQKFNSLTSSLPRITYEKITSKDRIVTTFSVPSRKRHLYVLFICIGMGILGYVVGTNLLSISKDTCYTATIAIIIGSYAIYITYTKKS